MVLLQCLALLSICGLVFALGVAWNRSLRREPKICKDRATSDKFRRANSFRRAVSKAPTRAIYAMLERGGWFTEPWQLRIVWDVVVIRNRGHFEVVVLDAIERRLRR